jgi:hypothetical protein
MQVTLTKVFRDETETKYGVRAKVAIQTSEHGDRWLSALLMPNKTMGTEHWEPGQTVTIDVSEKGDFLNFKPTGGASGSSPAAMTPEYEARIERLEAAVFGGQTGVSAPPEEVVINADDLPDMDPDDGSGF